MDQKTGPGYILLTYLYKPVLLRTGKMLQRTMFLHGLVTVPVIGSRFLAPAAFL